MSMKAEWPDMSKLYANSALAEQSIKVCSQRNSDVTELTSLVTDESALNGNYSSYNPSSLNTFSQIDNSTAATSIASSDMDEDEVDDDEVFSWVANGILPVNTSTTLALNQAYQEFIVLFMGRVEGVLAQVRERQKAVQNMLDHRYIAETGISTVKEKSVAKVPALLYVYPYFRDAFGLCPGLNAEANRIRENQEFFDMLVETRPKWSKAEVIKLKETVLENVRQAAINPLQFRKEILGDKCNSDDIKIAQAKDYHDQILNIDKQIAKIRVLNESQLIEITPTVQVDWNHVSIQMEGTRTAVECRLKWFNSIVPHLDSDGEPIWKKDEITKLKRIVESKSDRNWIKISQSICTKTPFDCFEKYQSQLNECLIRREWTQEDDARLREAVEQFRVGTYVPWNQIPFFIDGKTREQCQRRYMLCLNPKLKHGRWSEEEDILLLRAVQLYGEREWSKIAEFVGTRSYTQCRERWCLTLNSNFSTAPWSKTEDATLLLGSSSFGVGSWSKISQLLPGRSPAHCKSRYRALRAKNKKGYRKSNGDGITVNLLEEDSPDVISEINRQIKRRNVLNNRKERVKHWFQLEHGSLPSNRKHSAPENALEKLAPAHRSMIREKLLLIQEIYGSISKSKRKHQDTHPGPSNRSM